MASAATPVHAQFVSRFSDASTSSGLGLSGSDVMAGIVLGMAFLAFTFLVITFIRRRVATA